MLQREVSDLNSKLVAAASRSGTDNSAQEWAPYFQAAQRDHAQKIQVCALYRVLVVPKFTSRMFSQELNATHAADLRLLEEAKERERAVWEREIDAALAHVKVNISIYIVEFLLRRASIFRFDLRALTSNICRRKKRSSEMKLYAQNKK